MASNQNTPVNELSATPRATNPELAAFIANATGCSDSVADATAWTILKHYVLDASTHACPLKQAVTRRLLTIVAGHVAEPVPAV